MRRSRSTDSGPPAGDRAFAARQRLPSTRMKTNRDFISAILAWHHCVRREYPPVRWYIASCRGRLRCTRSQVELSKGAGVVGPEAVPGCVAGLCALSLTDNDHGESAGRILPFQLPTSEERAVDQHQVELVGFTLRLPSLRRLRRELVSPCASWWLLTPWPLKQGVLLSKRVF
jgi:hypothetical protein